MVVVEHKVHIHGGSVLNSQPGQMDLQLLLVAAPRDREHFFNNVGSAFFLVCAVRLAGQGNGAAGSLPEHDRFRPLQLGIIGKDHLLKLVRFLAVHGKHGRVSGGAGVPCLRDRAGDSVLYIAVQRHGKFSPADAIAAVEERYRFIALLFRAGLGFHGSPVGGGGVAIDFETEKIHNASRGNGGAIFDDRVAVVVQHAHGDGSGRLVVADGLFFLLFSVFKFSFDRQPVIRHTLRYGENIPALVVCGNHVVFCDLFPVLGDLVGNRQRILFQFEICCGIGNQTDFLAGIDLCQALSVGSGVPGYQRAVFRCLDNKCVRHSSFRGSGPVQGQIVACFTRAFRHVVNQSGNIHVPRVVLVRGGVGIGLAVGLPGIAGKNLHVRAGHRERIREGIFSVPGGIQQIHIGVVVFSGPQVPIPHLGHLASARWCHLDRRLDDVFSFPVGRILRRHSSGAFGVIFVGDLGDPDAVISLRDVGKHLLHLLLDIVRSVVLILEMLKGFFNQREDKGFQRTLYIGSILILRFRGA